MIVLQYLGSSSFSGIDEIAKDVGFDPTKDELTIDKWCQYLRWNNGKTFATFFDIHQLGKALKVKVEIYGSTSCQLSNSQPSIVVKRLHEFGLLTNYDHIIRMHWCNCARPYEHYLSSDHTCNHFNLIRNSSKFISKMITKKEFEVLQNIPRSSLRTLKSVADIMNEFIQHNRINFTRFSNSKRNKK